MNTEKDELKLEQKRLESANQDMKLEQKRLESANQDMKHRVERASSDERIMKQLKQLLEKAITDENSDLKDRNARLEEEKWKTEYTSK